MLLHILLVNIFLGTCLTFADSEIKKTLKNILDQPHSIEEAINASLIFSHCNYEVDDITQIIESATRILDFFAQHSDNLVLDAAVGTRMMEAQLNLFQAGHPNIPHKFQEILTKLQFVCKRLSEEIIDNFSSRQVTKEERIELNHTLPWVTNAYLWESPSSGNWQSPPIPVVDINKARENLMSKSEAMSELTWDKCISDIFIGCSVTDECAQLFMEKMYSKYSLTHQLFYFHFAEKRNCFNDEHFIKKMGGKDPKELMHLMCDKVWEEANAIQKSHFPDAFRDLLSEQVAVCSMLGYTHFLKISWLETILSWQNRIGCFLIPGSELPKGGSKRVKRTDNVVLMGNEMCSVHFTAVSLGAMAMHLRYLGDTCLKNY